MKILLALFFFSVPIFFNAADGQSRQLSVREIARGHMPNLAKDAKGGLHLVYGTGDSILYALSVDHGLTFSKPVLVALLPELVSYAMRGPQIAVTDRGLIILACDKAGNIQAYSKGSSGNWIRAGRVNDQEFMAKEGFVALDASGGYAYAVWLDLRGNKRNKLVGAQSTDGGRTWSKNKLVYNSPDSSICECCKPSALVDGDNVYVQFRNWLKGNRDLYMIQSHDRGNHFGPAEKLGKGSWALDGCPMDGGSLSLNANHRIQTIWRRQNTIYTCSPGEAEKSMGSGRNGAVASLNNQNVYAWSESGMVVFVTDAGNKRVLGKGVIPVMRALDDKQVFCTWENEGRIMGTVIDL